ncbi:hypothetical protein M8C21_000795 [Ambrosia artemisiifolia]|uniref:Glutaredoxin domain-containing protein n=1 Tax=Ambrosia artemisiifolia TaxID=4212 RepID=A0AAD5CKI7_AMBAR|nr:hypothetical protein M8C21_000795 [Ambrosia artemisiifolia]
MAATSMVTKTLSVSLPHIPNSPSLPFIGRNLFHQKTSSRTTLTVRKHGPRKIHSMAASFDSRLEDTVKTTVAHNPVVVYSKTWCPYSSEVKSLFNQLGVQPLVVELDEIGAQGPQLQKVLEQLTGQRTVPNVFIDTYNLHRNGELEALLADAKNT